MQEFHTSVDLYLESCEELGHRPNKPFKGTFNVRIDPELHRAAALASGDNSLNAFVSQAIKEKVERQTSGAPTSSADTLNYQAEPA